MDFNIFCNIGNKQEKYGLNKLAIGKNFSDATFFGFY